MSLTLVAIARNENGIDLTYEEIIGDPRPFVLTVTPTHVAHQVSKHLPTTADMQSYVLAGSSSRSENSAQFTWAI